MGKKLKDMTEQELYEYNHHACSVCGKLAIEDSHFYHNKMLCNRHYIQMYRYGRILSVEEINKKIKNPKCIICGLESNDYFRTWHGDGEYHNACMCGKHYMQMNRYGVITDPSKPAKTKERVCEECGDTNNVIYYTKTGQMLCRRHYDQMIKHGKILERTVFDRNEYKIDGDITYIYLRNQKQKIVGEAIIDTEDLDKVIKYKWSLGSWGYAETKICEKSLLMQRLILDEYDKGHIPDHINRNTIDNRKSNLRIVDKSVNAVNAGIRSNNTSGVTGVSYVERLDLYRAYINYQGKRIELGYRKNKDDAIKLRLEAELKYYPDYPPQKHLFKQYGILELKEEVD